MNATFRTIAVAGLILAAPAASAHAASWTPRAVLEHGCAHGKPAYSCVSESAPRAAVNAHGQTVVAWVSQHYQVRVASASANGRFGAPVALGKGLRPSVAITPGGTQLVVWTGGHELRFARRAPGHRFSKPAQLVAPASKLGDDSAKLAQQPDGSTLVVYENAYRDANGKYAGRLRSLTISAAGRPGAPQTLGPGSLDHDSFRAAENGQVAVCCLKSPAVAAATPLGSLRPPTTVASYVPGSGWSTATPSLAQSYDVETVAPGRGSVALGTIDVHNSGDAGTLGAPGVARLGADGMFGPPLAAQIVSPSRAFGPIVAIDGAGRNVLAYQEKAAPSAFSRTAPLYAVAAAPGSPLGARQVLDRGSAYLPLVRSYRDGAIVAWETSRNRWRVSVEHDGRFVTAKAPAGGPSNVGQDFNYSRDIATGGRYAVLCWTAIDGSIRASVGAL